MNQSIFTRRTSRQILQYVMDYFVTVGTIRSMSADKVCRYRGVEGRRCSIGCQIPDPLYSQDMEGATVSQIMQLSDMKILSPTDMKRFPGADFQMILQDWHDGNFEESHLSRARAFISRHSSDKTSPVP